MYYQTIVKRHDKELTKKTFLAMKHMPLKGDWIELLVADLTKVNMSLDDEEAIKQMSQDQFKSKIRKEIRQFSFKELETIKSEHTKVKEIIHTDMNSPQKYIIDTRFTNKMSSLLFNLRSRCENEFKDNFHNMGRESLCVVCQQFIDSQEHALSCTAISQHLADEDKSRLNRVQYNDLFSDTDKQFEITLLYFSIIKVRQVLQEKRSQNQAYHGNNSGPSG